MSGGRLYCLVPLFEIGCRFDPTIVHWALVYGQALRALGQETSFVIHQLRCCGKTVQTLYFCYPSSLLSADLKNDVLIQAVHPLHSCIVSNHCISSKCAERL